MTAQTTFQAICARILDLPRAETRHLIAVAGPPGSGKSTVAAELVEALGIRGRAATLVPMDGFHLDNGLLEKDGLLSRKGAPETFDSVGFAALVARLAAGGEVCFPRFDRERDLSIAQADRISAAVDIAVIEGNYLMLDQPPWRDLSRFWRYSVWLEVAPETLRERLLQRWLTYGLDPALAAARCDKNDMRNARLVMANRIESDAILRSE